MITATRTSCQFLKKTAYKADRFIKTYEFQLISLPGLLPTLPFLRRIDRYSIIVVRHTCSTAILQGVTMKMLYPVVPPVKLSSAEVAAISSRRIQYVAATIDVSRELSALCLGAYVFLCLVRCSFRLKGLRDVQAGLSHLNAPATSEISF